MCKAVAAVLTVCLVVSSVSALEINADYLIVHDSLPDYALEGSMLEWNEHWEKMFGKKPVFAKGKNSDPDKPSIIVSADPKLGPEEWCIRVSGSNLMISGGLPRGVYHGVCEFLEKFAGVRWFSAASTYIPRVRSITVPDGREFRRSPAFPLQRHISTGFRMPKEELHFMARHKLSCRVPVKNFWPTVCAGMGNGHSFYTLTKDLFPDSPMLPVSRDGRRIRAVSPLGPGQICYSNREFREYVRKEIGRRIRERQEKNRLNGWPPDLFLRWIDLSQNDNAENCCCKGCANMLKKLGSFTDLQLDFVNDIASSYPDRMFQTFAYSYTIDPPKHVTARSNVMIFFALLGDRQGQYDSIRALSHPANAKPLNQFNSWKPFAENKAVWAYSRMYPMSEAFPWPQCAYWHMAENIRFYRDYGAKKLYIESEYIRSGTNPRAFHDLHVYLETSLMDDPDRDAGKLIREFFAYQYGPAAGSMQAYSDYLKKRLDSVQGRLVALPLAFRKYFDEDFFRTIYGHLAKAVETVKNDPVRLNNVMIEYIPVDFAVLNMWNRFGKCTGLTRGQVCDRLEKYCDAAMRQLAGSGYRSRHIAYNRECDKITVKLLRDPLPVPRGMEKLELRQFSVAECALRISGRDPDAAYGRAVILDKVEPEYDHAKFPMTFGVYDFDTKKYELTRTLKPEEIPADEKYHLYYLGQVQPNGFHRQTLYGQRSWKVRLQQLYKRIWDPFDQDRRYDLYVSCKLTGPAYVKGSKSENSVRVDKIVCVKLPAGTPEKTEKKK